MRCVDDPARDGSRVGDALSVRVGAAAGERDRCRGKQTEDGGAPGRFRVYLQVVSPYGPVAIYLAVAFLASLGFCLLPGVLARKKPNPVKSEAYECGVEPTSDVSGRFPVRFYLIAMLFVIFDVEAASFYPWAVQMHQLRVFGLLEMLLFVVVLAIGYAYVWKRGGFQWR